ncbi:hypothetical protein N7456_002311 [Penicillium angulare]|uniref:Uncharacterized protein n=1 Tax=Penicillium angulare TaxID=116970 RepID=A0A9W9KQ35_9EURO|nr:hypothetical protein N7456_002311 [Penicillium angulare]
MLYEPVCDTQGKGLGLRQANDEIHTLHDDLQELGRPLVETLSKLGLSLPSRGSLNNENVIPAQRRELNSSTLNAATLKTTAETRICWVQTLDEHLILDEVKRELKIFCFPSFCLLCQMASPETVIQRFLNEYEPSEFYDEQHPVASFFKEILESYKLLFAENEASRHHYRRTERRYLRKALGDKFDPYLDELCGLSKEGKSTSNQPRIHYTDEFPILGSRLEGLQEFIDRQPPRSGKTLWKDKRNMKDWWTFWAVIIFGSIGTIIGILQVVLAVLQIVWAIKSYNLTLEQ